MNRPTRFFLLTPFLLESFGCASATQRRPNPTYPNAQSAAEVHVAVQSITPFEEIADALQPQFSITPEKALEEATPLALRESLASLRAFGANVGAGLPASTFGDTSTATTTTRVKSALSEQGVSSTEESALDERREENRTGRSSATLPVVTSPTSQPAPTPSALAGGLQAPVDRYLYALSLLQRVAMDNRYVSDGVINPGSRGYVVRALVTVMPYSALVPYDAYTTIEFKPPSCSQKTVDVVPLFATDAATTSTMGVSAARGLNVGASLSVPSGVFAFAGSLLGQRNDRREAESSELQPSLTLGRNGKGSLRVRMGAARLATDQYAAQARNYVVVFLLVAKGMTPADVVSFSATSELRRAADGTRLSGSMKTSEGTFGLREGSLRFADEHQRVALHDDGKTAKLTLAGLSGFSARDQVYAQLALSADCVNRGSCDSLPTQQASVVALTSQKASVSSDGRSASFELPSLAQLGKSIRDNLCQKQVALKAVIRANSRVAVTQESVWWTRGFWVPDGAGALKEGTNEVLVVCENAPADPPKREAGFALWAAAPEIVVNPDLKATFAIAARPGRGTTAEGPITLSFDGAGVSLDGKTIINELQAAPGKVYSLSLLRAVPWGTLRVQGWRTVGKEKSKLEDLHVAPLVLPLIPAPVQGGVSKAGGEANR